MCGKETAAGVSSGEGIIFIKLEVHKEGWGFPPTECSRKWGETLSCIDAIDEFYPDRDGDARGAGMSFCDTFQCRNSTVRCFQGKTVIRILVLGTQQESVGHGVAAGCRREASVLEPLLPNQEGGSQGLQNEDILSPAQSAITSGI